MAYKVHRPASKITPDKVLHIGGAQADALPDEMVPLVVRNCLRIAVDAGCEKIILKRGRWAYEFSVADLLREAGPVRFRKILGPSILQATLAGSTMDSVRF